MNVLALDVGGTTIKGGLVNEPNSCWIKQELRISFQIFTNLFSNPL